MDGNAILLCNLLPAMVDKLPDNWFYCTYLWFKYFNKSQRDRKGNAFTTSDLTTANPGNVEKWKVVANRIFVDSFKEEGRYQYGLEIACMAVSDGIWHEGKKGGRRAEIPSLAQRVLLRTVAPELLANDLIGKLFSFAYKWMHVLNLEGNKQWVKTGLEAFFKQKGAKLALLDQMTDNKRSHSIIKIFK